MNERWSMKDLLDIAFAIVGFSMVFPLYMYVLIPIRKSLGIVHFELLQKFQNPVNTVIDVLFYAAIPLIYLMIVGVLLTVRWARKTDANLNVNMDMQPD